MGNDDIVVEIHHGGKFMDSIEVEYGLGGVCEIKYVDIDILFRFEIIRFPKDIGFINVEEFYYLIPSMSLREGLRTCHNDFESLDMVFTTAVHKRLVVCLVHRVDVAVVVVPEMPTLPCHSMATQQSNVDPISCSINDGEGCCQKGGLDGSTRTIRSQNSKGTRVKHTPTRSPITQTSTPTPTPTSTDTHIPLPTTTTQKPQSNAQPLFSIEEFGESEYVPETEVELEAFENIVDSISKIRGKRKINVGGVTNDDGRENQ
ncbi:hypothetical protein Cgig2_023478 [Carnegiea gigantea]|uniref:PB1-like domain-containing protein n=1 Tax=Carnegiea gigantea TaxID=171969 RepID=A0A9Q1GIT9_9CARY|nr:hypothetical protein Cgig2_023478 [Carnegiea gigantea]